MAASSSSTDVPQTALEFTDVSFTVFQKNYRGKKIGSRQILSGVSGVFYVGKLHCILGPSGSGKTSLINILGGRMRPGSHSVSYTVTLGGRPVEPRATRAQFGFVEAHDALYPTDTPVEAFEFVAQLKLGRKFSPAEIDQKVVSMITSLGLEKCQTTPIMRGISSGEKRRTCIGLGLLPDPEILFLDEPTTGLDSYSALQIVSLLKQVAGRRVCVVAVLHQPSAEILALFDTVLFMAKSSIAYHGPVDRVVSYFSNLGFQCPIHYNPADYVMFLLQTLGDAPIDEILNRYRTSDFSQIDDRRIYPETTPLLCIQSAQIHTQFKYLLLREYRSTVRDRSVVFLRIVLALTFGTLIGFLFFQVGDTSSINSSQVGLVATLGVFSLVSSGQALVIAFANERPIIIREYAAGLYSIGVYSVCKDLLEYPIVVIGVFIYLILGFFIGGLGGKFMLMV